MTTIENENRTGIYVQESADATTAGDGLAQTRDKSPVASKTENIQDYPHFSSYSKNENEEKLKGHQSGQSDGLPQRRDKSPLASKTENVQDHPHFSGHSKNELQDHPHFSGHSKNENENEEKNKGYQSGQSDGSDYDVQSDQGDQGDQNDRNDQSNPTNDDKTSRKRKWMPKARNKKIYRYEFDQYYTSPAIKAGANESDSPYSPEGKRWKAQHTLKIMKDLKTNGHAIARMKMGLSGRHIERTTDKDDPNSVLHEVRIEDRSNPFKEISKENRVLLLKAIETTVEDENVLAGNNYEIKIGKYEFENKILLLRCKNKRTIRFLKRSIPLYNRLWPKADLFVLVSNEPVDRRRYKLKVNLPNYNIMSNEFFKVIGKQNNLPSEHWTLFKRLDSPGFCAFIGVDKISYRRIEGANGLVHFFFDKIQLELRYK